MYPCLLLPINFSVLPEGLKHLEGGRGGIFVSPFLQKEIKTGPPNNSNEKVTCSPHIHKARTHTVNSSSEMMLLPLASMPGQ